VSKKNHYTGALPVSSVVSILLLVYSAINCNKITVEEPAVPPRVSRVTRVRVVD